MKSRRPVNSDVRQRLNGSRKIHLCRSSPKKLGFHSCIRTLLWRLTRREGIRLFDLVGFERTRLVRDALLGFGLIPVSLVFILGGTYAAGWLLYGTPSQPYFFGPLPLPAAVYGVVVWPFIWGLTEQMTYNGYLVPRFQVLCRSTSVAIAVVAFAWSLQHVFMPLTFDAKFMEFRLLSSVPFSVFLTLLYLRLRRLVPLAIAHALLDGASVLMIVKRIGPIAILLLVSLAACSSKGHLRPALSAANGSINTTQSLPSLFVPTPGSPFTVPGGPQNIAIGDVDRDGKLDLITVNNADNDVSVMLGDGLGHFTQAPGSPFSVGASPYPLAVGDVNGDGRLDIVTPNSGSNTVTVLAGNGKGGFTGALLSFMCG